MGYVEEHLLPGEQLTYRARLHWIVYLVPALVALVGLVLSIVLWRQDVPIGAAVVMPLLLLPLLWTWILDKSSEFAVTDRRVVIKVGFIQRRTLETMLSKVEGIGVDQGVFGRMVDMGSVTITGTGGTDERFANLGAPLEFRRQVQMQISASDDARNLVRSGEPAPNNPRDERECPFCAERILARAKVCKHCGRDVEPLAAT